MAGYRTLGNTIYTLLILFSAAEVTLAALFAFINEDVGISDVSLAFASVGFAGWTFTWVIVLMVYFNRPKWTHKLCKVQAHTISHAILGLGWAAFAIGYYTTIKRNCLPSPYFFGDWGDAPCIFSTVLSSFTTLNATLFITFGVITTRRAKALGVKNNIASLWTAQPFQMPMTRPYSFDKATGAED